MKISASGMRAALVCSALAIASLAASQSVAVLEDTRARIKRHAIPPSPIELTVTPIRSDGKKLPEGIVAMSVFQLSSKDPRFGGWSDLALLADDHWLAISDQGFWLDLRATLSADGSTLALTKAGIGSLRDAAGEPLVAKSDADAEGMTVLADGRVAVSFERDPRVLAYDYAQFETGAPGLPLEGLPDLSTLAENEGLEALASLSDGRLLVGAERDQKKSTSAPVWIIDPSGATPAQAVAKILIAHSQGLTEFAVLDQQLFILRRSFSPLNQSFSGALQVCNLEKFLESEPAACSPETALSAPLPQDNFEGLVATRRADGGVRLIVLSDDNFREAQKTYLAVLDLAADAGE